MTAPADFQRQAVLWGQAFEVAVKRGVIASLLDWKLIDAKHPALADWVPLRVSKIYHALELGMEAVDVESITRVREAAKHLVALGYGLGFTAMREYLRHHERALSLKRLAVRALWCPLTLPGETEDREIRQERARSAFHALFQLPGSPDPKLTAKGQPANADFLLWLSGDNKEDHLLVQEYSYDMPAEIGDFRVEAAHLSALERHVRLIDGRGVFSRVCAEVEQESFELSGSLRSHLTALTSENKPFYKLCQGATYADSTLALLSTAGLLAKPCVVRALAITPNGFESLAARWAPHEPPEPRLKLLRELGEAYRAATKGADGDETWLTTEVSMVFNALLRRLPKGLRTAMRELGRMPAAGEDFELRFEEEVTGFINPAATLDREAALAMVGDSPAITGYFGKPARTALSEALRELVGDAAQISLRDLHASAVVAGLNAMRPGKVNVIGLEGNPGIGKTTAVMRYLKAASEGFLFLYISPRVVINRDVTDKLARIEGAPSGVLTVTTNARLMSAAERWYREQVKAGLAERRRIEGAVVADGVRDLSDIEGSILLLTPEQEEEIEETVPGSRLSKTTLSEHEDQVQERSLPGVLQALSSTTRKLLQKNPDVSRIVMTAATQGFRTKDQGSTVEKLSSLFTSKANTQAGVRERQAFAAKAPLVAVMVDELAGDGAGAPFVHAVANWLDQEFVQPFEDGTSPFTVALVVSDASLGNEVVLDRYLNAGERAPDKILISRSEGNRAFRLACTDVKIGGPRRTTLHVMTNSFPAGRLHIEYCVRLASVNPELRKDGVLETARQAIRRSAGDRQMATAQEEIERGLAAGSRQVIFFAQDKVFLRQLKSKLTDPDVEDSLASFEVEIIDSSVSGKRRKELVQPKARDRVRVFLMTSSAARGVSFPLCDWIIASVPRFAIEAALMEIAQLIYRGRGGRTNPDTGQFESCDAFDRRLVMLVNDYTVTDEEMDPRQWLRQAIDLMTLLTMLRATIYTRLTGDAAVDGQPLSLVPVGAVGAEELLALMSQYLREFLEEADVFLSGSPQKELAERIGSVRKNVIELFAHFGLKGVAKDGADGTTFTRDQNLTSYLHEVTLPISGLIPEVDDEHGRLPTHIYCTGPCWLESWVGFEKREVFGFEGWSTEVERLANLTFMQLREIDENRRYPAGIRRPASNLFRLLARENKDAALEFSTFKDLKSPNTWVGVPLSYTQFLRHEREQDDRVSQVEDPEGWRDALGRVLCASKDVMPVIPRYQGFPWAVAVGPIDPMRFEVTFDDRYFMASSELNLLNLLLLGDAA